MMQFHFDDSMPVTKELFYEALDFLVAIEPDPDDAELMEIDYSELMKPYSVSVDNAKIVIRRFGETISPRTLPNMQEVYYAALEREEFFDNTIALSVVAAVVNQSWDGIGPWQK